MRFRGWPAVLCSGAVIVVAALAGAPNAWAVDSSYAEQQFVAFLQSRDGYPFVSRTEELHIASEICPLAGEPHALGRARLAAAALHEPRLTPDHARAFVSLAGISVCPAFSGPSFRAPVR